MHLIVGYNYVSFFLFFEFPSFVFVKTFLYQFSTRRIFLSAIHLKKMLVIMKLCKIVFVFVLLGCLVCCEIPEDILPEFEAVFKGEGLDCDGTSAAVQVQSERNEVVGEGEVRAISEAVGESLRIMHEKPTVENAVALAESSSKLVLEVVALARASVSAQINSPNAGCFAVAFGKAEAVAVARAAVTAIAQAFAQASSPSSSSSSHINTTVQNVEKDVQVVVERIVLLLADGSGGGEQSVERNVQASSPSSSSSSHINTTVQNVEKDVQVVVERIVLLLADGSGGGEQSVERNFLGTINKCGRRPFCRS
eukprot:TRINITY_DN28982_c0_g2_i1.p2 TRINITY_DN28982_c0_g2~~TRINITY_DN28982_c0_g2_i1.p2  ORF type:complete len:309 (+),score=70.87 TRINITY_DN28982_c0_g2_i1:128-1054(+)